MLVEIDKIKVEDRIRKDFGDIEELAQDIKENGLINPPVVLPADEHGMYTLLAGERRLRALKSLGKTDTEVRVMSVRDAEQALNIEISENEVRKEFSRAERVEYARRLEKIEAAKARERKAATQFGSSNTAGQNSDAPGRTDNAVASVIGVSRDTLRREETIVDNKDLLSVEDFANWDEGKLSTNKAYQIVKARLKELEEENEELRNQGPEIVEVEVAVTPPDYDEAKAEAERSNIVIRDLENNYREVAAKLQKANSAVRDLQAKLDSPDVQKEQKVSISVIALKSAINTFIERYGGYAWLANHLDIIDEKDRRDCVKAMEAMIGWATQMKLNFEQPVENYVEINEY